ncbi:MAG: YdcF family protein [Acidobacteriota bacterium]
MEGILRVVAERLLLPPIGLLWLGAIGVVLALVSARRRRLGLTLASIAVVGLFVLSTPLVARLVVSTVDRVEPLDLEAPPAAEAVVVLGAGYRHGGREWGRDVVSGSGLDRLRYAVELWRRTGRPILVTGYTAETTAQSMRRDFLAEPRWLETRSRTTWENAAFSAPILFADGVERIYLVTHFWHMPRSVEAFEAQGLEVVPAPMGFVDRRRDLWLDRLLPTLDALHLVDTVVHEWVGMAWYRLRHGSGRPAAPPTPTSDEETRREALSEREAPSERQGSADPETTSTDESVSESD